MADEDGNMGCDQFNSFEKASDAPETGFPLRAKFFEKTLPMIEKVPARYFTPKGWRFSRFKFLDRSW